MAKLDPTKISEKWELFGLEIYAAKLKYTDTTPLFKMEIRLIYTEGNVCKDTKNHELQS